MHLICSQRSEGSGCDQINLKMINIKFSSVCQFLQNTNTFHGSQVNCPYNMLPNISFPMQSRKSPFLCYWAGWKWEDVYHLLLSTCWYWAFSLQDVSGLVEKIDPQGQGKLSFNDFCNGMQAVMHGGFIKWYHISYYTQGADVPPLSKIFLKQLYFGN